MQLKEFYKEENLFEKKTEQLIENYLFAVRETLRDELLDLIEGKKTKVLERKKTRDRILNKIIGFTETFVSGFAKVM